MAHSYIQLNLGTLGDKVDAWVLVVDAETVKREVDRIGGELADELADVKDATPASDAYGLVTRNIPSGTQAVSGPLTDAELRATAVPVSISGGATSANQATEIASLASIDSKTPALVSGRQPVDGSGVTQPISAVSLPLPSGAATETTLATRLAESTFTTRIPAQGQAAMAASVPVAIASNQSDIPIAARGASANPSPVSDGADVQPMADRLGRSIALANSPRELRTENYITLTTTGETTLLAAGAGGVFHDLHTLVVNNTSGTSTRVDIRDATGGFVRFSLTVPGGETRGLALHCPISQATAANNWTAQLSGAVTDVRIFAAAHKVT